jgi:NhaP-type Na+/H+ or K+/H+ antiporter
VELAVGVLVGALWGGLGGWVLTRSRRAGASTRRSRALGVAVLPLLAYASALMLSANGFVAAFIAGTAFAGAAQWINEEDTALELTEAMSDPLGYAVWLVFGLAAVPLVWDRVGTRELVFAALALTVLRMGPVALSLVGTGLRPATMAFVGWFGPRGLASVVFALLALESLDADDALGGVLTTISVTVLLSVVLHGVSAAPLARRYGAWVQNTQPREEMRAAAEPRTRGVLLAKMDAEDIADLG